MNTWFRPSGMVRFGSTLLVAALLGAMASLDFAAGVASPAVSNCAVSAPAQFSATSDVPVPDLGSGSSTITVQGLAARVWDVDVTTHILHTAPGDLTLTLTAPDGTPVQLSVHNGDIAENAFNGTVWDDNADPDGLAPYASNDGLVTDHAFVSGVVASSLVPQQALSRLMGRNPNGTWTLTVDDGLAGDTGIIDSWSLSIAATPDLPPSGGVGVSGGPPLGIPQAIPDAGAAAVSTLLLTADPPGFGAIPSLLTRINHPSFSDLQITLTSPSGTTVTLSSNNQPGPTPFENAEWPAFGGIPLWLDPMPSTSFAPQLASEESLAAFLGEPMAGTWTLRVADTVANGVTGTLNGWSFGTFGFAPCEPKLAITSTATPAAVTIGDTATWEITATNNGSGGAPSVEISGAIPNLTQVVGAVASAGGTCAKRSGRVLCMWPGNTPPGVTRRATFRLRAYVVGTTSVSWRARSAAVPYSVFTNGKTITASKELLEVRVSSRRAATGKRCTVLGTSGNDVLTVPDGLLGNPGVYCGLAGNDRIVGGLANETFDGGLGNDRITGAGGNDQIIGGPGADILQGGAGRDVLKGGRGPDRLTGGSGRDALFGGSGIDVAIGGGDQLTGIEQAR